MNNSDTYIRSFTTRVYSTRRGEWDVVTTTVEVDLQAIANKLVRKAMASKRSRSRALEGAIEVRVKK